MSAVDLRFTFGGHPPFMAHVELIPEYRPNGTVVLHAVVVGPFERLRRFLRRQLSGA